MFQSDVDFTVLTRNFTGHSPWEKDTKLYEEKVVRINVKDDKPYFLRSLPSNLVEKLRWKGSYLWSRIRSLFISGNPYDPSRGMERIFFRAARRIIRERKIGTVLLSVGPFHYSSILIGLTSEFPELKVVIDFRDFWEDAIKRLSAAQIAQELELQERILSCANLVLVPNPEMEQHFDSLGRSVFLLPHCFDPVDVRETLPKQSNRKTIVFVYGGAFYDALEAPLIELRLFLDLLNKVTEAKAELYVSIKGYEQLTDHPAIQRSGFLSSELFFERLAMADFSLLFLPPNRANAMSSKFFELMAIRKPVIYFGPPGSVSVFLESKGVGMHVSLDRIENNPESILKFVQNPPSFVLPEEVNEHTFEFQTRRFVKRLEELQIQ